jgi:hypothetical protein
MYTDMQHYNKLVPDSPTKTNGKTYSWILCTTGLSLVSHLSRKSSASCQPHQRTLRTFNTEAEAPRMLQMKYRSIYSTGHEIRLIHKKKCRRNQSNLKLTSCPFVTTGCSFTVLSCLNAGCARACKPKDTAISLLHKHGQKSQVVASRWTPNKLEHWASINKRVDHFSTWCSMVQTSLERLK